MARYIEDWSNHLFVSGSLDSLLPANSVARSNQVILNGMDLSVFLAKYRNYEMGRMERLMIRTP